MSPSPLGRTAPPDNSNSQEGREIPVRDGEGEKDAYLPRGRDKKEDSKEHKRPNLTALPRNYDYKGGQNEEKGGPKRRNAAVANSVLRKTTLEGNVCGQEPVCKRERDHRGARIRFTEQRDSRSLGTGAAGGKPLYFAVTTSRRGKDAKASEDRGETTKTEEQKGQPITKGAHKPTDVGEILDELQEEMLQPVEDNLSSASGEGNRAQKMQKLGGRPPRELDQKNATENPA